MTALALPARPAPGTLFMNHLRVLLARHWGILVVIGLVTWFYQLAAWLTAEEMPPTVALSTQGGLSLAGGFIFMFITAVWAFRVWDDLEPGSRETFHSYPVERSAHLIVRLAAGLSLYLACFIGMWLAGMVLIEIFFPGMSWFSNPDLRGGGWIISLIGIVNAYLLAGCFALLFRRPELWFFGGILVVIPLLTFLTVRANIPILPDALGFLFGQPHGLMSGLALASGNLPPTDTWEGMTSVLPAVTTVLIWTFLLVTLLVPVSRLRREV